MGVREVDVHPMLGIGFVQLLGFQDELLKNGVIPGDNTKSQEENVEKIRDHTK